MKTYSGLLCLLLLIETLFANASSPTFNVYITNESYPTAKTFRFDIWLKKTGAGTLEIANLQFGIHLNAGFRNGSVITPNYISGSSMFVVNEVPLANGIGYVNNVATGIDRLNISGRYNPGCGAGTFIPDTGNSCMSPGIRFATIQLTTSLSGWPTGVKPNLDFNFIHVSTLETKISYYPQPCPSTGFDATTKGTFYDWNSSVLNCTQNPVAPGCSLITSTTVNSLLQPSCFGGTGNFTIANTFSSILINGQARYSIDGTAVGVISSQGTSANMFFSNVQKGVHLIRIERGLGYSTTYPFGGGTSLCNASLFITITEPTPVTATATIVSPVLCFGENGIIAVTATGGSGNYKYWGGSNFASNPVDLVTKPAGMYSFLVTDQNNCSPALTDTVFLNEAQQVIINSITHVNTSCQNCNDGYASVNTTVATQPLAVIISGINNPSNAYSINGFGPVFNFTGLVPDYYRVEVITNEGCLAQSDTIKIRVCADSIFINSQICTDSSYVLPNGNIAVTSGVYTTTLNNASGCDSIIVTNLAVNSCEVTLNLRIFFEGFYIVGGRMKAIVHPDNHPDLFDSVTVELHESFSPYALLYSSIQLLTTDGFGSFYFPSQPSGHSYYIVVRHRNSVATWSKYPVQFNSSNVSFDFTRP